MRRALVLTNEAARHPFRQTLPAWIFALHHELAQPQRRGLKLFLRVYVAGFLGTYFFIS